MSRAEGIHEFWFGALDASGRPEPDRPARWFTADEAFDAEVRGRFEADLRNAVGGRLGRWERTPRGALALILLFDQFPRNMYRGTARAFLFDESARAVLDRAQVPVTTTSTSTPTSKTWTTRTTSRHSPRRPSEEVPSPQRRRPATAERNALCPPPVYLAT